ncbi:MAG: AraC family transcriptional regulator [Clostridia bacterium]|nr:AraC family transcriptional regulator [Clostridia bacterium]
MMKQHWKQTRYSYRATPRPDFGLMLLLRGEVTLICEEKKLTCRAGDLVFLPKKSRYEAVFDGEAADFLINFDTQDDCATPLAPLRILGNAPFSCIESFQLLVREAISGDRSSLKCKGLFCFLLDCVTREVGFSDEGDEKMLMEAKKMLCDGSDRKISQIARALGISESGLRKKFKEKVSLSPTAYRLQYKMERAKYLLESTDLQVGQIADQLNFYDAACFCRAFRAVVGMTPLQFAKRKQL